MTTTLRAVRARAVSVGVTFVAQIVLVAVLPGSLLRVLPHGPWIGMHLSHLRALQLDCAVPIAILALYTSVVGAVVENVPTRLLGWAVAISVWAVSVEHAPSLDGTGAVALTAAGALSLVLPIALGRIYSRDE